MKVDMVDDLVGVPAVVIEDVEVVSAGCERKLLDDGEDVGEVLVGQLVDLGRVVLGDDEAVA